MINPVSPHYYNCKANKAAPSVGIIAGVVELCDVEVNFPSGVRCYKALLLKANKELISDKVEPCRSR